MVMDWEITWMLALLSFLMSQFSQDDDAMEVGGAIAIDGKEIREKQALGRIYTGSACE